MSKLLVIARKELGVFFTTATGYAGFGAYAFLMGLLFISALNRFQQLTQYYLGQQRPDMLETLNFNDAILAPMFSSGVWMFLFFVPFLTMRLFAEEKSARTFELLMTAPVTSWDLVLGKFLASGLMVVVMATIPVVFPLILESYGSAPGTGSSVEWNPVWSALGFTALLGLMFVAIGLWMSALTESQLMAALLTFGILLMGYILPLVAGRLEGDWRAVLEYLSPVNHVSRGIQGRVLLEDLVYFVSVTAACLFYTQRVVESHRWR
jgi:ABC-2 type transport system permease protein